MKYLYLISHPAHFHMFKFSMRELEQKGHQIIAVIRSKDVLEQLCIDSGMKFIKVKDRPKKFGIFGLIISMINRDIEVLGIVTKQKPDLLIGSDGTLARVGRIKKIPSFEFSEDDARAIKLYAFISYTFFNNIISPKVVDAWLWEKKKIGYNGYQKLAYLHPKYFNPDIEIKKNYIVDDKYFLIRLSALDAYHDIGMKGFNERIIDEIINLLQPHGRVFISSEKPLLDKYKQYELKINPLHIHHILFFSTMLIGDSQSMTVESALLGVPSFRLSSFVGKLSVLEELEYKYHLTFGFKPIAANEMIVKISEMINSPELNDFKKRRNTLLNDKIDVTAFFVWFIENYPESVKIMKENPDYQYKFK